MVLLRLCPPLDEQHCEEAERLKLEHLDEQDLESEIYDQFAMENWQSEGDGWLVISIKDEAEGHFIVTFKPASAEIQAVRFDRSSEPPLYGDIEEE